MSDKSNIEWTDATWNPTRGCSRVSEGCRNCYAEGIAFRFSGPGQPFEGFAKVTAPRDVLDRVGGRRNGWTGNVALVYDKLAEPMSWRKPRKVFVNSMSDLFHEVLPDEAIDKVFAVMAQCREHTFQILTKRAERMRRYLSDPKLPGRIDEAIVTGAVPFKDGGFVCLVQPNVPGRLERWPLPNVWIGTSVENQHCAEARIPLLLQAPAVVRFISVEPLLSRVDLCHLDTAPELMLDALSGVEVMGEEPAQGPRLDWVIVGGESGPGARPCETAWIRSIVRQCKQADVPVFVKQLGAKPHSDDGSDRPNVGNLMFLRSRKGGDMDEWPEALRVREFPEARA